MYMYKEYPKRMYTQKLCALFFIWKRNVAFIYILKYYICTMLIFTRIIR